MAPAAVVSGAGTRACGRPSWTLCRAAPPGPLLQGQVALSLIQFSLSLCLSPYFPTPSQPCHCPGDSLLLPRCSRPHGPQGGRPGLGGGGVEMEGAARSQDWYFASLTPKPYLGLAPIYKIKRQDSQLI